jgi:hypothetical protein
MVDKGTCKIYFFYFSWLLKIIGCLKQTQQQCIVRFVTYIEAKLMTT